MSSNIRGLSKSARRLLAEIARKHSDSPVASISAVPKWNEDITALLSNDLVERSSIGTIAITSAGLAFLDRSTRAGVASPIDPFRAQHLDLAHRVVDEKHGLSLVNESESPLAWLARRKGRDGRVHIAPLHLQAGERLRGDFTRAQLMPHTTSNWNIAAANERRGGVIRDTITETAVAARQRVRHALEAVGPEFSGLLLDICCFLKGLTDAERDRGWPPRSAKVVLQLGLERLARHYGLAAKAYGRRNQPIRTWLAPDSSFAPSE